jgi:ribose-phosphate pyrophosphokinase
MMLRRNDRNLENIPVGALGLIALDGCTEMGAKVNDYLVKWRKEDGHVHKNDVAFTGYEKDTYLIDAKVPRFGSGEAKGIINESVRGKDLYLMVDVCNYSLTYSLTGNVNHMSPDDHFQNLKRIIAAVGGKGRRINVIMPFLYESRQAAVNLWTVHLLFRSLSAWVLTTLLLLMHTILVYRMRFH